MKNTTANDTFTRCDHCGYIYENSAQSCPECGTPNSKRVYENVVINESSEPVFNIID